MKAKIIAAEEGVWNNYHTHTFRCHHATGDVDEFAQRAAQLGMTKLGMSDHAHVQGEGDHPQHMHERDIPGYLQACRAADRKYADVRVLCGVECDYDPSDEAFFRDYYLEELGMDYLIGSVHELRNGTDRMDCFSDAHFGAQQLRIYTDLYVKLIESRIFTFCAHPDLFGRAITIAEDPNGWDANAESAAREILDAAQANGTVLEMNVSGVWKTRTRGYPEVIYPKQEFWEMASDYDIPVILNTDAHSLERLNAFTDYGFDMIRRYKFRRVELE